MMEHAMPTEQFLYYTMYVARCEMLRHLSKQSCIASSRLLAEIYRRMGVRTFPLTVSVTALNEPAWQAVLKGEDFYPGDDRGSTGVRITRVEGGESEQGEEWWGGHLVLIADGKYLADPSADQMSRPDDNLIVQPALLGFGGDINLFLDNEVDGQVNNPLGGVIQYTAHLDEVSYMESSDWSELIEGDPLYERVMDTTLGLVAAVSDAQGIPELPDLPVAYGFEDRSPEAIAAWQRSLAELGITPEQARERAAAAVTKRDEQRTIKSDTELAAHVERLFS